LYIGLHVECPLFFSDFNENLILLRDFRKIPKYQILWKSVWWEQSCCIWTDGWTNGQTYMTKLILRKGLKILTYLTLNISMLLWWYPRTLNAMCEQQAQWRLGFRGMSPDRDGCTLLGKEH